ncbi:hypothetical protein [endosymbiont GvMRE of Glomus versiforme]|uniref:hypothetical protein n=1 Tax=endosymbiont GvMRE of Glomus versiforme TaxID=2039283 RepID=UPI000EE4487D|nr:hypothetical protein [endosymbiont GvMRE of Glomus versiforme]RHZ36825.1 hypothetical protein GvMRE_I2g164 [endosymbiont GvMRE of Glomus versiforme]
MISYRKTKKYYIWWKNDKKKKQYFKWLVFVSLILLTVLLAGFFFFLKSKEKENQIGHVEKHCFNCKKEVLENADFCQYCGEHLQNFQDKPKTNPNAKKQNKTSCYPTKTIKIQKTTSGKYFVKFSYNKIKNSKNKQEFSVTTGKNVFSAKETPKILSEYQECWENNDWTGWEKELKDNYLLVKERRQGEDSQFHHQTNYEFHPISEADQEEKEAEQRKKECKQRAKESKERAEEARERAKKWKEEHKNEWRTCHKCGKNFCLGTEGSIKETWPNCDWDNPPKVEYFCGNCTKR